MSVLLPDTLNSLSSSPRNAPCSLSSLAHYCAAHSGWNSVLPVFSGLTCLCPSLRSSGTQVWVWWASHRLHCFPLSLFILLNCSSLNPPGLSHKIESSGRSEKCPDAHSYIFSIKPRAWNLYKYLCENEYMRGWMSKWGRQEWWQRRHEKLQWIFQGILWEREKQILPLKVWWGELPCLSETATELGGEASAPGGLFAF